MNIELSITTPSLDIVWPITVDEMFALADCFVDGFGMPSVEQEGEPVDMEERIRVRMGEIGTPKRTITTEPVETPEKAPEPIQVPSQPEPVPA